MGKQEPLSQVLTYKDRLFSKYLWSFYAITVLVLGSLILACIWFVRSQLRDTAKAQTQSLALALHETNQRQLEGMTIPLEYLSRNFEFYGGLDRVNPQQMEDIFSSARKYLDNNHFRNLFVIDREGDLLSSTVPIPQEVLKKSFQGNAEFNYIKSQKNYTIVPSRVSKRDQKRILILAKTLRNAEGRFVGIIGITRAMDDFETFYKTLKLPEGVNFSIFRDDGRVIYRYPQMAGLDEKQIVFSKKVLFHSEGPLEGPSALDGAEKIAYYKFSRSFGAMTYVGYRADAVFASWRYVSLLIVAIFGIFMGSLIFMVNMVRRRQRTLTTTMEEHHYRENIIRQIQEKTEHLTGHPFLRELSLQIARVFEVKNVAIGVLLPERTDCVKFVVNWVNGSLGTDYVYDLKGSPFENLNPGEIFSFPKAASRIFSMDPLLTYHDIEACMGMIVRNSEQNAIGLLMIYSEEPMQDMALKRAILPVFAARVGAELERIHTDEIRKEVETLRKQIEERSSQSEKMEAIGTLAEGIAHDFNNILAIILATTEKLLSFHKESDQDQHYLEAIKKAVHRARHVVSQIMIFSRKGETSAEAIPIKNIFGEILDFLDSTLPAQIRVTLDMGSCGDSVISADIHQIQQALLNLCVNAAKSIGVDGGEIRISLRKAHIKERPYVKWSLHYNGQELGREELEKLFDPFYAESIGMVLVQKIVTNHQGFIEVKSATGKGTDIDIFLPVLSHEAVDEIKAIPFQFKSSKKVMIVDDEPEIGLLIKELLETEGLSVDAFEEPERALEAYKERPQQYFLIISDLSMPMMSGLEFVHKIREFNAEIPLVLWSGYHQVMDEELQALNIKVLSKPVDVQKLLTLIQAELSQAGGPDTLKEDRGPGSEPLRPREI